MDLIFLGYHVSGVGKAHQAENISQHDPVFHRRMVGTFNVCVSRPFEDEAVFESRRIKTDSGFLNRYFLVGVSDGEFFRYAWVMRWKGSTLSKTKMEFLSRVCLPETFRRRPLRIRIYERWSSDRVDSWAKDQYWFQTFPWSPVKKADSNLIWRAISNQFEWGNSRVLDVGSHYGYHSLMASRAGADVVGFEPELPSRTNAEIIDRHIEQEGISYVAEDPGGTFDSILYFSVHHQIDPSYAQLQEVIRRLRSRCRVLFVELILPSSYPEFGGGMSDSDVDTIVGGRVLKTYKHRVRGVRRIYRVTGEIGE